MVKGWRFGPVSTIKTQVQDSLLAERDQIKHAKSGFRFRFRFRLEFGGSGWIKWLSHVVRSDAWLDVNDFEPWVPSQPIHLLLSLSIAGYIYRFDPLDWFDEKLPNNKTHFLHILNGLVYNFRDRSIGLRRREHMEASHFERLSQNNIHFLERKERKRNIDQFTFLTKKKSLGFTEHDWCSASSVCSMSKWQRGILWYQIGWVCVFFQRLDFNSLICFVLFIIGRKKRS